METHPDLFFQPELTLLQLMPKGVYLSNLVSVSLFYLHLNHVTMLKSYSVWTYYRLQEKQNLVKLPIGNFGHYRKKCMPPVVSPIVNEATSYRLVTAASEKARVVRQTAC